MLSWVRDRRQYSKLDSFWGEHIVRLHSLVGAGFIAAVPMQSLAQASPVKAIDKL